MNATKYDVSLDPRRVWGRTFEELAIAYWVGHTSHHAIRMPDLAKVDALVLPIASPPYWLETKARRRPFLDSRNNSIYLPATVWASLKNLAYSTKLAIRWLVVGPDQIMTLLIDEVKPTSIVDYRAYFDYSLFDKIGTPEDQDYFEGVL